MYLRATALGLLAATTLCGPAPAQAGGVTIITHGFLGDVNGWISGMATRIPQYPRFPGTNFTTYTIALTTDGSNYFYQWQRTNGSPVTTDSGEIIVKLDWSQMAALSPVVSTIQVAKIASYVLLQTNAISDLGGHALAESPLHLVGHSRGGSLISEMSRLLGTNGVWVDHLTTLDPHPVNNDGFIDFIVNTVDATAQSYANVLFHDNYWQNLASFPIPIGEPVSGAHVRRLTSLNGGNSSAHSDVHLWYHGTIDWRVPADDTEASLTSSERQTWWTGAEQGGTNAGFVYSLIGGASRLSTNRPAGAGTGAIVDGYNQNWDLGAGAAGNRTALNTNNGDWPSLIKVDRTETNLVTLGQSVSLRFYYQWARASGNATVRFYLDKDRNPFNANQKWLGELNVPATGAANPGMTTFAPVLDATNVMPGSYWLFAVIEAGGRVRELYAPQPLQVLASRAPPVLEIVRLSPGQVNIVVNGLPGQTVVLQASTDFAAWVPVATNALVSSRWVITNAPVAELNGQYYRAALAN